MSYDVAAALALALVLVIAPVLALALAEILVELPELESNSAERETWWGPI